MGWPVSSGSGLECVGCPDRSTALMLPASPLGFAGHGCFSSPDRCRERPQRKGPCPTQQALFSIIYAYDEVSLFVLSVGLDKRPISGDKRLKNTSDWVSFLNFIP